MRRKVLSVATSCLVGLAGIVLLTLALTTNVSTKAMAGDTTVLVSITESGFDPSVVTVTAGTVVTWTNYTTETVHMVSGKPYRVYLPLVLSDVDGTRTTDLSHPMVVAVTAQQDDWLDVDIIPNGSYSYTFSMPSSYPYFLVGHPDRTGLVVVEGAPADFALGVQPSMREVAQGESVTYTVALTALNSFADPVTLAVGGAPTGTTVAWTANPLTPSAETTLSITPSMSSPTGTYTLVITGTGGGRVHTAVSSVSVVEGQHCPQTGAWTGETNQYPYTISFNVVDTPACQVESLYIKYRVVCIFGIYTAEVTFTSPALIWNNHFEIGANNPLVKGDFTSPTTATGTWDVLFSHPTLGACLGDGTWDASTQ